MVESNFKGIYLRKLLEKAILILSWRRLLSYRNQSIDLGSKSMDWFLYDNGLRHERVNKMHFESLELKYSLAERYWNRYKDIWSVKLFPAIKMP